MKKIGLIIVGTGVIIATGGLIYYLYRQYQMSKLFVPIPENPSPPRIIPGKLDAEETLSQCVIQSMEAILSYYNIGAQLKESNNHELKKELQAKSLFCNLFLVEGTLQNIEDEVCARLGWNIDDYYKEIARLKKLGYE